MIIVRLQKEKTPQRHLFNVNVIIFSFIAATLPLQHVFYANGSCSVFSQFAAM
jgi:hypothetical protein